jgi:RNA polymerase sigma factor (sigma-70 family)
MAEVNESVLLTNAEFFTMTLPARPTEKSLISGCIANDQSCQLKLYKLYYGKMMVVCLRYAKDRDEAKDILQEGFIKIFEKLKTFEREGSLEGWIRRIITNVAIDNFRKNKVNQQLFDSNVKSEEIVDTQDDSSSDLFSGLDPEEIIKALQSMTPVYRTVINLYVLEGFTHREIAEKLGISEGTSKSNYARAKMRLKELLMTLKSVDHVR